jgi:hypothetical protein
MVTRLRLAAFPERKLNAGQRGGSGYTVKPPSEGTTYDVRWPVA